MPQFGQPRRDAAQDANEGKINQPVQTTPVSTSVARVEPNITSLDRGVQSFGEQFGAAAQQFMDEEVENIREKKMVEASIRQGQDHAINEVDKSNERTGWMKFVFGQDAGYEEAQRRAVANSVNALYLEQAVQVDQYAGHSPEEYQANLADALDGLLAPHQGDQATKDLIAASWATSSAKLVDKQYIAHRAYAQTQNRLEYTKSIQQAIDTVKVDRDEAITEEAKAQADNDLKQLFDPKQNMIPQHMTKEAHRTAVNEVLFNSIAQGNKNALDAAVRAGWFDNNNPVERAQLDDAINKYSQKFVKQISKQMSEFDLMAANAQGQDDIAAIKEKHSQEMQVMQSRSLDTDAENIALNKAGAKVQNWLNKANAKVQDLINKAADSAAKAQLELDKMNAAELAVNGTLEERVTARTDYSFTDKELSVAADNVIGKEIDEWMGSGEPMSTPDRLKALVENPKLAERIREQMSVMDADVKVPLIKNALNTFIAGFDQETLDGTGQPTPELLNKFNSIGILAQDTKRFIDNVGKDQYKDWLLIQKGIRAGRTSHMIRRDLDQYQENKGKLDTWKIDWNVPSGESMRDVTADKIASWNGGVYPDNKSLSQYMESLRDYTFIEGGDTEAAWDRLRDEVKSDAITYDGKYVAGGNTFENINGFTLPQLLDGAGEENLLVGVLESGLGDTTTQENPEPIRKLSELKSYSLEIIPGMGGVYVDTPDSKEMIHIPQSMLQLVADSMKQTNELNEAIAKARKKASMVSAEQSLGLEGGTLSGKDTGKKTQFDSLKSL